MSQMRAVCDSARYFRDCDVIDIQFTSGHSREVYVAHTPEQRQRGLSEVAHLDLDGMLFLYPEPSWAPFTVANMVMDIDITWFNAAGQRIQTLQATAGDPNPLVCKWTYTYVLETPVGTTPDGHLQAVTF
jgi:uncharacterized membrane protein (UPF0127 family)